MAVEVVEDGEVPRSYSTEKRDIEQVEQVSDTSPPFETLQNREGESVAITWKTWAVIFVCFRFKFTFFQCPTHNI